MEKRLKRTIYVVCGRVCSGKGHYYDNMFDPSFKHIMVSDIVREITQVTDRTKLADTAHLDFEIVKKLTKKIEVESKVFIDGVRQPQIIEWLEDIFDDDIFIYVWIEVPTDVRKKRFEKREDLKDKGIKFEHAEKLDTQLGLHRTKDLIMTKPRMRFASPVDIGKGLTSYKQTFKQ